MNDSISRAYRDLHRDVQSIIGGFTVPLVLGDSHEFPEPRNMAYCVDDGEGIFIVVAPKLSRGSESRIQAILRHELAHALEFEVGEKRLREMAASDGKKLHRGAERRADQVAEIIWGDPIFYDNIEVQTLDRGTYPRPIHLGE